ncbi:hypothetical protein B0A52_04880 [Exophiala mesophila]|uniref:Cytochrome P450 n=1 Tax=Exophiala mesophila TaxID=212818 RepID=A0A438N6A2_EXOME|nr:hypothetical protein B0A52_04880 [Exophiala mesophila]
MVGIAKLVLQIINSPSALLAVATVFTAAFVTYRLFFGPLSKIPGPWITAITGYYVMYQEFKGDRTVWLDGLHVKYGPVVRVSPAEVSFNSVEALKEIYGIKSQYSKSHFYDMFVYYNERNTFTSLDRASHTASKRLVADRYAKTYVMQDTVAQKIQRHASAFLTQVQKSPFDVDVYTWLHYYALDCITNHLYGQRGTKTLSESEHRGLVYDLSGVKHRTRLYMIYYFNALMAIKEWVRATLRKLEGNSAEFHVRGSQLNDYGKKSVEGFRTDEIEKDKVSTCSKLLQVVPDNENRIAAECMDHLVAGVDTTGDAMCITMWRISTPEYVHIQDRLLEELKGIEYAFDPATGTASIAELDKLPYLDAVLHEGLRWRPPVPMTLFRVVPPGGATIDGFKIPAALVEECALATTKSPMPPSKFDPSIVWNSYLTLAQYSIAMVEMKILMGAVYRQYRTLAVPECTEESMRMDDQLTSGVPYALTCKLSFEKR